MGVVWGDGPGAMNQGGQAADASIPDWIARLARIVWRRLFLYGGRA